jgi:hypothetical protein
MNMDLREIRNGIESLPAEQQRTILDWLAERELMQWAVRIEQDLSPGGTGMDMLGSVKVQMSRDESASAEAALTAKALAQSRITFRPGISWSAGYSPFPPHTRVSRALAPISKI